MNHLNSFREVAKNGKNIKYYPLNEDMVKLYLDFNIQEFEDGTDETNYTLFTKEKFAEWREKQGHRISKRGGQGGEG